MQLLPRHRPQQPWQRTATVLAEWNVKDAVALLGVRGYFRDSMGAPGKNDRAIYDDAIIVCSPACHVTYNANTDPSVTRDGVAVLCVGLYQYKLGIHGLSKPKAQQYEALVQASAVRVLRDGGREIAAGYFGINIHRGGNNGTSSLGCQTIYPGQWDEFLAVVKGQLKRYGRKTIPYLLLEYQG